MALLHDLVICGYNLRGTLTGISGQQLPISISIKPFTALYSLQRLHNSASYISAKISVNAALEVTISPNVLERRCGPDIMGLCSVKQQESSMAVKDSSLQSFFKRNLPLCFWAGDIFG